VEGVNEFTDDTAVEGDSVGREDWQSCECRMEIPGWNTYHTAVEGKNELSCEHWLEVPVRNTDDTTLEGEAEFTCEYDVDIPGRDTDDATMEGAYGLTN
jgi:hypothetical protein